MSKKAVEMEHLYPFRGSVRGTWREGFYKTCNGKLWKRSISFIGVHKGNLRHLAKEGSVSKYVGLGYCTLTGLNQKLLVRSFLDITPCEDISTQWG
jgi:hypothetical protein